MAICSRNEAGDFFQGPGVLTPPPVSYEQPPFPLNGRLLGTVQALSLSFCLPVGLYTMSHPGAGGGNFLGPAWVQKIVFPGDSTYPPGLGTEDKFATLSKAWAAWYQRSAVGGSRKYQGKEGPSEEG